MRYWLPRSSPPPRWLSPGSPQAADRWRSRCWGCPTTVDSWTQERCPRCGWVRCHGGHCRRGCPRSAPGDGQGQA